MGINTYIYVQIKEGDIIVVNMYVYIHVCMSVCMYIHTRTLCIVVTIIHGSGDAGVHHSVVYFKSPRLNPKGLLLRWGVTRPKKKANKNNHGDGRLPRHT